ncbi:MAG: nicotinate-nucleotide adenylyltransferase [Pseudomonadota bacterium]
MNDQSGRMSTLPPLPGPYRGLRIGLFGGSFNPAHAGHVHVAETALQRLELDAVWWLVANGNPFKEQNGQYDARFSSAQRLVRHPRMRVTAIERAFGVRYTADLLDRLLPRLTGAQPVLIIGADNLAGFHLWGRWSQIADRLPIAVISRPGASPKAGLSKFARRFAMAQHPAGAAGRLAGAKAPAWTYIRAPLEPMSSTELRREAELRQRRRLKGV